jgi:dephospho-CoA kinase
MPIVVAFSGKSRVGKTTLSRAIATQLNFGWASFGDYVRSVAAAAKLGDPTDSVLLHVGARLVEDDVHAFTTAVLSLAGWRRGGSVVLDGLRHLSVADQLRQIVAPEECRVVFVEATNETRARRYLEANDDMRSMHLRDSSHLGQDLQELCRGADLVIRNEADVSAATGAIVDAVARWTMPTHSR